MAGPDFFVPDPDSERFALRLLEPRRTELVEYERAREAMSRPAPEPEPPVCLRHDWNPPRRFPGEPRPPASMCPECRAEADHLERKPPPEHGYPKEERAHPLNAHVDPRLERAWHAHLEEQRENGLVVPGSLEELRAIESADAQRQKDIDRDHRPRRRVAFERIEGGRVVQFHHPARRPGSRSAGGPSWHESDSGEITVEASDGGR
jgi:hypothetical protein